jgi:hypothetical protein
MKEYKIIFNALIITILGISIVGCYKPVAMKGPNGKEGYTIRCGLAHPERCYNDAATSCPNGYKEVSFNPGNLETPIPHMLIVTCNK